ncbi:MAG TPA: ATP-binding protein [Rhodothermales bacterium]|nr:ATP-binding protein [Rhodothermales bacterium]
MITPDDLRCIDVFRDQPEEHLAWLASVCEERFVPAGVRAFERGTPATYMTVVLSGSFQIFTFNSGTRQLLGTVREGDVSGLLPFSRMERFVGEGMATADSRLALVPKEVFGEMLMRMPEVGQRLVGRMTDRVREAGRSAQQREKLLALGKLAAGLAHELNNPAAAIRRAVADLEMRLQDLPPLVARLMGHGLAPDQVESARAAVETCTAPTPGTLGAVDRSDREDRLADWLDDHGVPEAYLLAEVLVEEGVTPDALEHLGDHVPDTALPDVIRWVEKGMAAERLMGEITRAAGRISELVAAIKGYAHMDRAPERERTDVHAGLDQTLTMLGHDVKKKSVRIEKAYGEDVPGVCVYPGEINQVWTNLLDNALDAVADGGRIRIETRRDGDLVAVAITDDGPGIPPELQPRIFEPFFTTKPPGEGTGLGLDVVHRIVTGHEGTIDVQSRPGATTFTVRLPIEAPRTPVIVAAPDEAEAA